MTPVELSLITSEHATKPNFMAAVQASIQGMSDTGAVLATLPGLFDLDTAVGAQLDVDGQWIGQTRYLSTVLGDTTFRALLYGAIGENLWDGTIPSAYAYLNEVFAAFEKPVLVTWYNASGNVATWRNASGQAVQWEQAAPAVVLIQNYGNKSMGIAIQGTQVSQDLIGLLVQGRLSPRPAGVLCYYFVQSIPDAPFFGLDAENASVSGFDVGAIATIIGNSTTQAPQ